MKTILDVMKFITGGIFNILIAMALVIAVYSCTTLAYNYGKGLLAENTANRPDRDVTVLIEEDDDTVAIARKLKGAGLINNTTVFELQARLNGSYKFYRAGTYTFNMKMSSNDIMQSLQTTQFAAAEEGKVTIVEGLSNKQIAAFLEEEGIIKADEFLEACEKFDVPFGFLEESAESRGKNANRLEGYLFPDTYNLPPNPEPDDLIIRMLNRFNMIYDPDMTDRADDLGLTTREVIIMASIVEKEIKRPEERALCASVINNRLEIDMPLQMCSTVLYALDKRKASLTDEDLKVKSPYNTYENAGLPEGPICNPGKAAIMAVLYPDETNYLYFVVKDEETGEHVFTADYNTFVNAKIQFNQKY